MKWNKLIFGALIAGSLLSVHSCSKIRDFGGINSNPNQTTEPVTKALLTNVLAGIGNTVWGNGITINAGLFAQYFSETQYTDASRYAFTAPNWGGYYAGAMNDLQNIINYNISNPGKAGENGDNENQIAIARILKTYYYWIVTDTWGDLPYFEALKGDGAIPYDSQEDVYADMDKELDEAVDQFVTPTLAIQGDILLNGDINKWKKLANSMRLLMAIQLTKKYPAAGGVAATRFNDALSHPAGVIESNSDNATLAFPGGVFNHPLYQYYFITLRFDYGMSETIATFMNNTADNRRNAYGSSTNGVPYGYEQAVIGTWISSNSDWAFVLHENHRTPSSPVVLIGAANVYLARAEAANRGWTSENQATMYSMGVQRSWEQWGVYNASNFASYMALSANNLGSGNALQKINMQQWMAFYPNGTRGWSNWRRTDVPALTPAPNNSNKPIPRRMPYGSQEPELNPTNYNAAAAQYTAGGTPNSQDAKIWWDQ